MQRRRYILSFSLFFMRFYFSARLAEKEKKELSDLFTSIYVRQCTIPVFWRLLNPSWYLRLLALDVYFIYTDEYSTFNIRADNPPTSQHLAVTFKKRLVDIQGGDAILKDRYCILFDLTLLEKTYQRLRRETLDYFSLNAYAFVISHELVHLQILIDDTISISEKWKYHRFLDQYSQGEYPLGDVYDSFRYRKIQVQHYNYQRFKQYAEKFISIR